MKQSETNITIQQCIFYYSNGVFTFEKYGCISRKCNSGCICRANMRNSTWEIRHMRNYSNMRNSTLSTFLMKAIKNFCMFCLFNRFPILKVFIKFQNQ